MSDNYNNYIMNDEQDGKKTLLKIKLYMVIIENGFQTYLPLNI